MKKALIVFFAVMVVMLYLLFSLTNAIALKAQELQDAQNQIRREQKYLREQLDELTRQREAEQPDRDRLRELREFLDEIEEKDIIVTAYAPLDPRAKEGMCYQGNPNVTASGSRPVPGLTAAAGRGTPFYSLVYVADHGWRMINDRGEALTDGRLDLTVENQDEAFRWGMKKLKILMFPCLPT